MPWAKGVDAAGQSTNKGWAIRRYEGMQRAESRTQSGLHFSCRGRPGSYWKYLHVIYGAHMLQEPNAPTPPPLSLSLLIHLSHPLLFRLFSFDCLPFSVSPFPSPLPLSIPSSAPEEQPPCRQRLENSTKRFTPLLPLPLPSHRRNNEYSYGLNFWWNRPLRGPRPTLFSPSRFPSPFSFARDLRRFSRVGIASCMEASRLPPISISSARDTVLKPTTRRVRT